MTKRVLIVILTVFTLLLPGCRRVEGVVWSSYTEIPKEGWDPIHVLGFSPWPEDSVCNPSDRYSLVLSLRFPSRQTLPPITLVVNQEDNERTISSDTIVVHPSAPSVNPFGQGSYGVYETADTIARGLKLSEGYLVELQTLSPQEDTAGLMNVGLTLSIDGVATKKFGL